jgi:hypothetical protein
MYKLDPSETAVSVGNNSSRLQEMNKKCDNIQKRIASMVVQ